MFTDQLNRQIFLQNIPERIISLVPSQTELLVDLGLGDKIVGVTKFCVHPKGFKKSKTIIGGTKKFNFDKIQRSNSERLLMFTVLFKSTTKLSTFAYKAKKP